MTVTEGRVALASVDPPLSTSKRPKASASSSSERAATSLALDNEWAESLGTLSAGQVAIIRSAAEETTATGATPVKIVELIPPKELEERLAWCNGILMFSGDRLEDVVKEVSRYTTVSIDIPDAAIRYKQIGGRCPVGETDVMLAALETNFHLRVTHFGHNRVVLSATDE